MENIILTNNKDLRLVGVKVGVLSTLRFELPLVSASATHVEVIVTSGNVPSAYTATFISDTKRWQCDIAASQFPAVGKQSYEVAYVLDGKQFWDGKGWIEIEDATTSGIEPQPRPEPYRYAVVSVNGYGADSQGAVRIPKTFIATDSPTTTEGFMEGDIYFNRETGAAWTLCDVQSTLTWVFNYKNYYTKAETDEAIDKLAAYYITADAQGNPFATKAALVNAQTYYSGGAVRTPTRNDYAVVLADEAHGGAEWRYIYAVADGQTTGQWEAQYPIETNDYAALSNKPSINDVTLTGNKTAADLGLASEAEAEALRTGKQNALSAQQLANIAAVPNKLDKSGGKVTGTLQIGDNAEENIILNPSSATITTEYIKNNYSSGLCLVPNGPGTVALAAPNPTAGNLAALDANGNPTDSQIPAANVALKGNLPYALVTKTITNGAVSLDDRAINAVAVSSSLASLTVNFPTATSGKARDFGLRLTVASGVTTAPQLVLPQGVTCENADGAAPEIGADGAATILYFTETASGVFLVKGEVLQTITA